MRRSAFAVAAALALCLPAAAQMDHGTMDHGAMQHGAMTGASKEYMDAMTRMDQAMQGMAMTGKPGQDFATMMIPHHQAAIDMAKSYLASGESDPELVGLSNEIIAAQEREIAMLRAWLAKNPR